MRASPRAAVYHRVSTLDQDPTLLRSELRSAAKRLGYRIVLDVEETGSGAQNDRPGFQSILRAARASKPESTQEAAHVTTANRPLVPLGLVEHEIFVLRRHRIILDERLALLYGVEVKVLNQAVKRNRERFPEDFMFQLTEGEARDLRSQIVTSRSWGVL